MPKTLSAFLLSIFLLFIGTCGSTGSRYQGVGCYSEGLAPVQAQSGQRAFVNEQQLWIIPSRMEDAKELQGGKATVQQTAYGDSSIDVANGYKRPQQ